MSIRSVQRWISAYIQTGTKGLEIKKTSGTKSRITDEDREIMLSVLFNDPNIFGYIRNTWSLRSLAKCLTEELDIPISFRHLQRILKDMGIRCKRPKLELEHGPDYEEGKKKGKELQASSISTQKKKVMLVFEDETIVTQKPCIRKSMSFEGEQQKIDITVVERDSQCTYPCYGLNRTCCMISMRDQIPQIR